MDVLTFSGRQIRPRPTRSELDPDAPDSLTRARLTEHPAAYVVRNEEVDLLRGLDGVVDRGRKHPAADLSRLLLRQTAVPLIRGTYRDVRQLLHSVRSLLRNAVDRKDRNVYVIGADADLFQKLWAGAREGDGGQTTGSLAGVVPCEEVLNLLASTDVPPELEQRFTGTSRASQLIRRLIMRAASTSDDVLIVGDTGTGKEVVARCIHDYSGREPFVHVSCAAFPAEQLDGALFGEADGASVRPGFWQQAKRGMLFLDEIGGLRPEVQAKIMRALTERRIRPLRGRQDVAALARVVVASNRDLFALMQGGQFREDLYYRLRAFTIRIPPLRARPEDIPLLAQAFWRAITWDEDASLSAGVLAALESYHWPGNARELKAILSAVHALFGATGIRVEHVRAVLQDLGQAPASGPLADGHGTERTIACLRHLRHVDEVIRACQITLKPFLDARRISAATVATTHETLHFRLHELEVLCMQPLLFHGEGTFKAVWDLKGKLAYFHGLLETDPAEALRYWKKQVAGEMEAALAAVVREEGRLMEGV